MFKKIILFVMFGFAICAFAQTPGNNTVEVVYNGTTATVNVADNVSQYLTITQSGAHIKIAQSGDLADEITYKLSGTSDDGEFYMSGSYKATVELNGLTLTNTTPVHSGAAIHIQNSKRINVKVTTGTTNTLVDAATGSQKGCLYVKGHAEFKQKGTLNVVGNVKHGIKAGEYISLKNATINVTSAVGDGISCNQYFLMESGTITISGTGDDGIQCDLDGNTSTGETIDHEDEDSGNIYIKGGTVNITCTAAGTKGFKCAGDMVVTGGNITVNANGTLVLEQANNGYDPSYCTGIKTGGNLTISDGTVDITCPSNNAGGHGISTDNDCIISGGTVTLTTTGTCASYTDSTGTVDAYSSTCVKSDGNIIISGGTLTATAGGRALSADGDYVQTGGSVTSTTSANGFTTIGSGTSCTDGFAPTCLKADGNIVITGGTFSGTSTGKGGRGISCDGTLTVGEPGADDDNVYINITTSGSPVNGVSSNNSSVDIWKGLPKGIKIDGNITINSGHVQSYCSQTSGDPNGEALESKDSLFINGGYIETNAYDDAINASNYLEINGGYVWAYSRGNDAIDCNGTSMYINGGTVIAMGSECGVDDNSDHGGHLYITGGTLVAVGSNGSGMGPGMGGTEGTPNMVNQKYISLGSSSSGGGGFPGGGSSGSTVSATNGFTIKNSHSTNILTFKAPTVSGSGFYNVSTPNGAKAGPGGGGPGGGGQGSSGKILVSSPDINCDSYTYFTSPTISGGSNWHGLYSGGSVSTSGSGTSATAMPTSAITYSTHLTVSTCEPYTWHGTTYTTSGNYTVTLTSIVCGVDSVVTLHLTVNSPDATESSVTACESYDWNGVTYTISGIYEQTFTNVNGCDSVVTLYLTVNHGTHNAETETAHESYEWHGETYTESGTYTFEYENNEGCESTDTLHLTVTHCAPITIPYSENFDTYTQSVTTSTGVEPTCWVLVQEDVTMPDNKKPQIYCKSSFAHSGSYSLMMNYRGIYAMPLLSEDVTIQNVKLEMYLRQANAAYQLQVGVWDDELGTFSPVALFNNETTGVEFVACDFSGYTGNGRRIAFRNVLGGGANYNYSYNYIDDITLSLKGTEDCAITLPYNETFEGYTAETGATGVEPDCWNLVQEDVAMTDATVPQLFQKTTYAHSGNYSLRMYNRGIYAMPALSSEVDLNEVKLEMYVRQPNKCYQLQIGVWDEQTETFDPVALVNNSTTDITYFTCDFSGYEGNGRRIAFRNTLNGGANYNYSYNYIDDISLSVIEPSTNCDGRISTLPYEENFDSYTQVTTASTGVEPDCWELVREEVELTDATRPQLYCKSSFAHSGNYSLKMSYRCVYAMPALPANVNLNDLNLSMYLRQANAAYRLEVGVWDDQTQTFEAVQLFNNSTTNVEPVSCDFSGYTGNGHRIAFRNVLADGAHFNYSYNYLDDITLSYTENARNAASNENNLNGTGIGRLLESVTVYPNPTKDYVNVQCTMNNVHCSGIEVIDMYGKVIYTVVGANNYSPLQTRINVSGLAAGMYFVRVTTDQGVVTKTFVKR